MQSQVTVSWGEPRSFKIDLEEVQPMPHEQARAWLDQQFTEWDCDPIRLSGKVLTADKVLLVAQAAGLQHFTQASNREWAETFARAASAALAKPVVGIDLESMTLSY